MCPSLRPVDNRGVMRLPAQPGDLLGASGLLTGPVCWFRGQLIAFGDVPDLPREHVFGGPLPERLTMPPDAVLHTVMTVECSAIGALSDLPVTRLPVLYPFRHSGGLIEYTVAADGAVDVERVQAPAPTEGWPYEDYPVELPRIPLAAATPLPVSFDWLRDVLPQGLDDASPDDLVLVVPSPLPFGVSLWGEDGDAEGVVCVFVLSPEERRVRAHNQCT